MTPRDPRPTPGAKRPEYRRAVTLRWPDHEHRWLRHGDEVWAAVGDAPERCDCGAVRDAQSAIFRERLSGPRWSEALREGRRLRERTFERTRWQFPMSIERELGLPCSWWGR